MMEIRFNESFAEIMRPQQGVENVQSFLPIPNLFTWKNDP